VTVTLFVIILIPPSNAKTGNRKKVTSSGRKEHIDKLNNQI